MKVTIEAVHDFYKQHPELIGRLTVKTRFGYKKIEACEITARKSDVYKIKTESGHFIKTSPEHRMLSNDVKWVHTKDLKTGDFLFTEDGPTRIKYVKKLTKKDDLYDIQVEDVREYYANGLVSHNSVILDSICYALFGKPYRNINKPQLVNSINQKNCLVELLMDVNGIEYKIIRGMKPGIFEVYCDQKMLDQDAAIKDMQLHLETQIIKLNFRTFCQVVILGSAGFTPFMKLSAAQRREVIEDVLDISIFSKMNGVLKDRSNSTREELSMVSLQIGSANREITAQRRIIDLIRSNQTSRVSELEGDIEVLRTELKSLKQRLTHYDALLGELDVLTYNQELSKYNKLNDQIDELKSTSTQLLSKLKKIGSLVNCPMCLQGVSHDHTSMIQVQIESEVEGHSIAIAELSSKLEPLADSIKSYELSKKEYETLIKEIRDEAAKNVHLIKDKQSAIHKIKADTGSEILELDKLNSQIKELTQFSNRDFELKEERQLQDVAQILLKDGGIKTAIIREYLPALNSMINRYLTAFDFFVNFNLDENFEEVIKSRGRDEFSYASFSEGEKKRLDLAILLAFRQIAALKNSAKINLLIMDEVIDSSLDLEARAKFTDLLDTLSDSNVIVISHTDTSPDAYSAMIQITKQGDFSTYKYL